MSIRVFCTKAQNYQIIMVNDGSTDDTGKICEEYQKNNSIKYGISVSGGTVVLEPFQYWDLHVLILSAASLFSDDCAISICGEKFLTTTDDLRHWIRNNISHIHTLLK